MGASLAIAAVVLAPFAAIDVTQSVPTAKASGAVVVLGLICTAAAFVVFSILIHEAGTSRATVITYVNPVVALALGVTLLSERPGAGSVVGLLLILAGSWLATGGSPSAASASLLVSRVRNRRRPRGETASEASPSCSPQS
jgi:drug/metabolite transporter (DMT)-like permease